MKKRMIALFNLFSVPMASAMDLSTTLEFIAPTVPKIEKPACAKVELIKTEKILLAWKSNDPEPLKFTYLLTFHKECQGTISLTSTFESRHDHHTDTISKTYYLAMGTLKDFK